MPAPHPAMNIGQQDDSSRWFALRVKPRAERCVAAMARYKGFEELSPVYQCRRRWSDRIKIVEQPLFPGYVFCRLNPQFRFHILTIPGALHLVGLGKVPVPIDDAEIRAIQALVRSGVRAEPWPFLDAGQRVRLEDGPLAGLEGIVLGDRKQQRIVVSVSLLRRSVSVEVSRDWLTLLDASGRDVEDVGLRLAKVVGCG